MRPIIPAVMPPLPHANPLQRNLAPAVAWQWLAAGWRDLLVRPATSLAYGIVVFAVSEVIVAGLFSFGWDYILFPALAGFMVVGPAAGHRALREKPADRPRDAVQPDQHGVRPDRRLRRAALLHRRPSVLLMLLWMRAAVIIYALFFGLLPFPGLDHVADMLFTTTTGWAMLVVGSVVGALFASFSFAISVFSVPLHARGAKSTP